MSCFSRRSESSTSKARRACRPRRRGRSRSAGRSCPRAPPRPPRPAGAPAPWRAATAGRRAREASSTEARPTASSRSGCGGSCAAAGRARRARRPRRPAVRRRRAAARAAPATAARELELDLLDRLALLGGLAQHAPWLRRRRPGAPARARLEGGGHHRGAAVVELQERHLGAAERFDLERRGRRRWRSRRRGSPGG